MLKWELLDLGELEVAVFTVCFYAYNSLSIMLYLTVCLKRLTVERMIKSSSQNKNKNAKVVAD